MSYAPFPVPREAEEIPVFLKDELRRIASAIAKLAETNFPEVHVEPIRPRDGDVRNADGSDWNPGSGKGLYYFDGSTWTKL
jgi:hypothetical protein